MILKVPYYSQVGFGADKYNNDCGPACCSMCLAYVKDISISPDAWYNIPGWNAPQTDVGTYAWQLRKALALFDVDSYNVKYLELYQTFGKKPVIALVDYGVLSGAGHTWVKGKFLHWVVVVGLDHKVIIHDPYYPEERGANIEVNQSTFDAAYKWSAIAVMKPVKNLRRLRKPGDRFGKPERMVK